MDERSSPGRYRGRRRVPVTPRSRYAAVFTTAMVGAGVVALSTGAAFNDAKVQQPGQLAAFDGDLEAALADRAEVADRTSRSDRGSAGLATSIAEAPDVWRLPVRDYTLSSAFGWRWDRAHEGVDLAAPQGTEMYAAHAGTVIFSGWNGGYGYAVIIDHGDGVRTLYGHSSELLVSEGQEVEAGDLIALMGNTGYSFGSHLHFEVHVNGQAVDPLPWMAEQGVDLGAATEEIYGS